MPAFLVPFKPVLIRLFIAYVLPKIQAWAIKMQSDPEFKAESDKVFSELNKAETTEELRNVAKKIFELQGK